MKKRIIAVHLLNDRSGSPLVFSQALAALSEKNEVILFTATPSGDGFLSGIKGIEERSLFYKWSSNKLITLFYFLLAQLSLFFSLVKQLKKTDTLYVNTLLPFGAAFAGGIRGCKIVYHIHETSLKPAFLKTFLFFVADHLADRIIFVSKYVSEHYIVKHAKTEIIYNCLPQAFIQKTSTIPRMNLKHPFTVTMLCSLKEYKGIYHFVTIARQMPGLQFVLVLNTSQKEVENFKINVSPSANCTMFSSQQDTVQFYESAHVVMNLSKPEGWVETFGMTLLEAMHCGRPVICPKVGGVLELVTHGVEGFTIDSSNESGICQVLKEISSDIHAYEAISRAAYEKSRFFDSKSFDVAVTAAVAA